LEQYRANVPDEIYSDPRFSFRVYQIPKTGNHRNSSDLALEVVYMDPNDPEAVGDLNRRIALIREKHIEVVNQGKLKAKGVVAQVASRTGRRFNVSHHTNAWKLYNVRRKGHSATGCNTKYCQFDEPHKDYVYTQ